MTLRDDIRAGFDRQQAKLGEVGDARPRLMHGGLAAREAVSDRVQWMAGIAAVLIAVIVIATFALVRGNFRSHSVPAVTPSPRANVSPTPLQNALNVPDATPVIPFHDPADFNQIDAITWDAKVSGKMALNTTGYASNPAASLFGTGGTIVDRSGRQIGSGSFGFKFFSGTWADDEVHFCQMVPFDYLGANGVPATLQLVVPGQPPKNVARVGKVYEQAFIRVAACSVEFGRAVVVQSAGQGVGTAQYWVLDLNTGKILWTHNFQEQTGPPVEVVSSRDGQFIAESSATGPGNQAAWTSTIFGPDGAILSHIAGMVYEFSWDGSLAVVDPGNANGPAAIVRVRDDSTVWSGPLGQGFYVTSYAAEPDGSSLAVGVHNPAYSDQSKGFLAVDLYVVAPDGHVTLTMRGIYW